MNPRIIEKDENYHNTGRCNVCGGGVVKIKGYGIVTYKCAECGHICLKERVG